MLKARAENHVKIMELNPRSAEFIEQEIECQKNLIFMKAWWPHYQWLKKNKIDMKGFKKYQEFVRITRDMNTKLRVMDVQASI